MDRSHDWDSSKDHLFTIIVRATALSSEQLRTLSFVMWAGVGSGDPGNSGVSSTGRMASSAAQPGLTGVDAPYGLLV